MPLEIGVVLVERKRLGCGWESIVAPRGGSRSSVLETLRSVAGLYAVSMMAAVLAGPAVAVAQRAAGRWLPRWAIVDGFPEGVSTTTLWLGLVLSGVVAQIVEELYFRGLLMPRIRVAGAWAPAVNAGLFAIYHFFSPWNYLAIFVAFLPLTYSFRLRGKLLPVIVTRCLFNTVGIVAARARLVSLRPRVRS
jgi:CAAX protease family protein